MFDKPELASKIRITEYPKITSNEYPYEAKWKKTPVDKFGVYFKKWFNDMEFYGYC